MLSPWTVVVLLLFQGAHLGRRTKSAYLCTLISTLITLAPGVYSYIPASPTNSTQDAIAGGLNITDVSKLHLQWYSNGSYWETVSYQLVGHDSLGISKGALVHFSETSVNNNTPATTTPWIALVSCDFNATNASQEIDIFTLARDKGAVSALLYSLYSTACVINPEYADPETFDQVFDIFSTQSLTSAHLIEYQFGQIGSTNDSISGTYNSQSLNDSAAIMNATISLGYATTSGFLYATLRAYNATGDDNTTSTTSSGSGSSSDQQGGSSNTALAMIVLYAITGCVSALFCVIIVTGAIRAIRHPERYGPRRRGGGEMYQSRTQGLTRAILDTFPIVKFGSSQARSGPDMVLKDPEALDPNAPTSAAVQMQSLNNAAAGQPAVRRPSRRQTRDNNPDAAAPDGEDHSRSDQPSQSSEDVPVPAAIGRETCPICIVDFEEDDDVRILPCEGHHRFHQQCVDPWLLGLSSSCPICRQDFLALESMLSIPGDVDGNEDLHPQASDGHAHGTMGSSRFSRYIRSAMRRRRQDENDPTEPYLPTAAHTTV
ncbi:uncharacterized protein BT62DRAFT_962840 [Guyanagaster necrorhizus]|uniref:RING-type domain-containing protein n=1 Tax=Guyanagaster necrorhizus TaxID=856835 RepID=A0A9P7W038_9AGAR|nr:uncharacterized protein BT62DRAFT_962840 [Guyanagaster necrorhizus MCA 3950]KAG7449504.1 hypothetical protein BT62DRAFT_962840 [Guyanagaster necrorhizus MCA 3950]